MSRTPRRWTEEEDIILRQEAISQCTVQFSPPEDSALSISSSVLRPKTDFYPATNQWESLIIVIGTASPRSYPNVATKTAEKDGVTMLHKV